MPYKDPARRREHDRERRRRERAGVLKGAAAGNDNFLSDLPPVPQVADVTRLLSAEINRLRRMQADDLVRARAVGFLCNVMLKSLEVGSLEERLASVEARISPGEEGKP